MAAKGSLTLTMHFRSGVCISLFSIAFKKKKNFFLFSYFTVFPITSSRNFSL